MAIKGLNRKNRVTPGLARAGVIRLGYKAKKCKAKACGQIIETSIETCPHCNGLDFGNSFPREAPHFILKDAPGLAEALGTPTPTELNIYFPFDGVDKVFPHYMQMWQARALVCRGDGEKIIHAIDSTSGRVVIKDGLALVNQTGKSPHNQYNAGDPMPCPGIERNLYPACQNCKPNAMLIVSLQDVPRLAYYQISTTSIQNILNLPEQIHYVRNCIEKITGTPRIAGIPFILRRVKRTTNAPKTNKKRTQIGTQRVEKYFLELEIQPEWMAKLMMAQRQMADPMQGLQALPEPDQTARYTNPPARYTDPPTWEPRDYEDEPINGDLTSAQTIIHLDPPKPVRETLTPHQLIEVLSKKIAKSSFYDADTGDPLPIAFHPFGPDTAKLISAKFKAAFGDDPEAQQKYHACLNFIFEINSANNLTAPQGDALLDWLLNSNKELKWAAEVMAPAPQEAQQLYRESQLVNNQLDLFEDSNLEKVFSDDTEAVYYTEGA